MRCHPRQRRFLPAATALAAVAALTASDSKAGVAPRAQGAAQATADPVRQESGPLDDLLVAQQGVEFSLTTITTRLLEAGSVETGRFLRSFEAHALQLQKEGKSVSHLARLASVLRESPVMIASVIGRPEVPASARADAAAVAFEILRRDSTDRTLETLVKILERSGPLGDDDAKTLQPGLREVVERLTEAEIGSVESIRRVYVAAAPRLSVAVVDGIARSDSSDFALRRLTDLLGVLPSVDGAVLNRIHMVSERQPTFVDSWTLSRIADYLDDDRPFSRHEAAATLGRLGDRSSVPALIWLLEDSAPSVREAAHRSLKTLTSMTIGGDSMRWRLWLERQEEWWNLRGEALVARIPSADRGELVEILRETCTKRLYHREIAPALLELLARGEVDSIEIGLSALGTLRAPSALPAIRMLQGHPNALVRRRAEAALRSYRHAKIEAPFMSPLSLPGAED